LWKIDFFVSLLWVVPERMCVPDFQPSGAKPGSIEATMTWIVGLAVIAFCAVAGIATAVGIALAGGWPDQRQRF
jgi:hypothetical protein